ncbi:MAG: hypothetical protein AAFN59_03020 [Pseudomonadota bacterium]
MSADFILVIGIIIGALSIPSVISAFSGGRPPTMAGILLFLGSILVVVAFNQVPGGYSFGEIPGIFVTVFRDAIG